MSRILIFGNSGSGKSTLAKELCRSRGLSHLDLDNVAWADVQPPSRLPLEESSAMIAEFLEAESDWVIEGCYTDLLEMVASKSTEIIFLNLPVERCIQNARNRPWEPEKYETKAAQDAFLDQLIEWIALYPKRSDGLSLEAHSRFYEKYVGKKRMYVDNRKCD